VALRTIEAGEIIFKENPLISGPFGNKPICLGFCEKSVTKNSPRCEKCGVPVCSKACADSKMHKTFECEVLKKSGWFKTPAMDIFLKYPDSFHDMIFLLRIFLLREKDPDCWALIWNLESHKTEKQIQRVLTAVDSVVDLLQKTIGLLEEDIPIITTIMGIINVNQFTFVEIEKNQSPVVLLFGLSTMPMHDCLANAIYIMASAEEGYVETMKALRTIKEGEQITMRYMPPLRTVLERQNDIASKFFVVSIFCISSRQ
jgi:hypothetical protein